MPNNVRIAASLEDRVSSGLDRIRGKMDTLGGKGTAAVALGSLASAGLQRGLGLVQEALSGVVDQAFQSVNAASSLNEAVSKSQAVFGEFAGEMDKWASTAADSFGQSKRSALEAAGTYGNLFQAFGIGRQQAADMSKNLVELASDLASFNNTSVDEALLALRSGLSGETEPLKRFGVALNDARLKEEALRMGLIKTTSGVLPQAIKTQAAYALILKDTTLAQGDFDRTSDGLANTQKSLAAAVEDAQAKIGEKLLPVMLTLANFAKDTLVPAIVGVSEAVDKVGQGGADNSDILVNLGNILDDIGQRGEKSKSSLGALEEQFMDMLDPMATLLDDFVDMATFWDTYVGKADEVSDSQRRLASAMRDATKDDGYVARVEELANALPEALEAGAEKAVRIASVTPQDLADALHKGRNTWESAIDSFNDAWDNKLSTQAEQNKLLGFLQSDKLAKGMKSADPVLRAQSTASANAAVQALQASTGKTWQWGKNILVNLIKGMDSQLLAVDAAAQRAADKISDNLRVSSPAKKGPMSRGGGPEGWARRFGDLYAKGLREKMPDPGAMLSMPAFAGGTLAVAPAGSEPNGGGAVHVHFHTLTVPSAAQREELERTLTPIIVAGFTKRRLLSTRGTF